MARADRMGVPYVGFNPKAANPGQPYAFQPRNPEDMLVPGTLLSLLCLGQV